MQLPRRGQREARRVIAHCEACKIFVSGQRAVIKARWPSLVPAEAWLWHHPARSAGRRSQPEPQGAVGVGANRIPKAFVRPVECTDAVVFAIAERRLAPNVGEVYSVRRSPLRSLHELGREPVLGG